MGSGPEKRVVFAVVPKNVWENGTTGAKQVAIYRSARGRCDLNRFTPCRSRVISLHRAAPINPRWQARPAAESAVEVRLVGIAKLLCDFN